MRHFYLTGILLIFLGRWWWLWRLVISAHTFVASHKGAISRRYHRNSLRNSHLRKHTLIIAVYNGCTKVVQYSSMNFWCSTTDHTPVGSWMDWMDWRRRGCAAPRSTKAFYVDTVLDSRYVGMDVLREREGSLNGSEVGGGMKNVQMRNGMCRKMLESGAALKAIVIRESARSVWRCTVWVLVRVRVRDRPRRAGIRRLTGREEKQSSANLT